MKPPKKYYETLSACVDDLVAQGYTTDFLIEEGKECLVCAHNQQELSPAEFDIDEVYRFEGMTDPDDSSIVFAISSKDGTVKGLVINAFGAAFSYHRSQLVEHLLRHI